MMLYVYIFNIWIHFILILYIDGSFQYILSFVFPSLYLWYIMLYIDIFMFWMYFIAICKLCNLKVFFLLSSMKMDHVSFIITNKINLVCQYINWMIHCLIILSGMSFTFKIGYFMTKYFFQELIMSTCLYRAGTFLFSYFIFLCLCIQLVSCRVTRRNSTLHFEF